jgi:hypothetical protein
VYSDDMLLKCRTNVDRYSSAGVGELCVSIFSSLQGWLCVGVLCVLQCAKNSVGSCRQSHRCLNVCRMSFRVTYNVDGLLLCWGFISVSRQLKPNKITDVEVKNKCLIEIRPPDIS